ncbi:hypothetical protein V2G26_011391 [Clonostachys chloroleuca]|uniref:Major facilitator superfamily (MFS) profile domain-containing protein n=1 Tax=Clonostachys chloroleuca TaxID=1926264 RepID=A0AA35M376_9HYPO|nr:unnamed protein product [Clonostachys chloroleuca]
MTANRDPEKPTTEVSELENHESALKPSEMAQDAAAKGQATSGYEHLTIWESVITFRHPILFCTLAAFSAAADGYQIGINASIVANKGFIQQFATKTSDAGDKYLESPILSGWGSIMSVGQIIGTMTIPFISHRFGRKAAMFWLWLFICTSVLAESLARDWPVWLVAKLLAGYAVGSLQATLPLYISELAPTRIRGGLLMSYQLWWALGGFSAQIALRTVNEEYPYKWLVPIYTQWAHVAIMLIIFFILPESPVWYATRGLEEKSKRILTMLHRNIEGYDVDHQYNLVIMMLEHERAVAITQDREQWWSIFRGTDGLRTVIAFLPGLTQQFIGLKLFGTFGTYFFQQAGVAQPFTVKCITSSIQIATVLGNIVLVENFGRRPLACWAATLSWVSCCVVGILGVTPDNKAKTYVFVLFACFWNIGMMTCGTAASAFNGEISSQRLRPYTAAFAVGITCVVGVIMDVLVPYMVNSHQWNWSLKTGWFYTGLGLPTMVAMWLLIPETKGRSTAELDELFERKIKPWRFVKTETATERLVRNQQ